MFALLTYLMKLTQNQFYYQVFERAFEKEVNNRFNHRQNGAEYVTILLPFHNQLHAKVNRLNTLLLILRKSGERGRGSVHSLRESEL